MNSRRSTRTCAEILFAALKPGHAYTRDTVLGMRVLSATELGRARECLLDCGAIRSFQVVTERRRKLFCIALTGKPLPQPKRRVAPKKLLRNYP